MFDPDRVIVHRCRFYTTLTATDDDDFGAAADKFVEEFDEWWRRFSAWVGILASQDFVKLGGSMPMLLPGENSSVVLWTNDPDGQRADERDLDYVKGYPVNARNLGLADLKACVTATGNQDPPPAEWLFIREARLLLNDGQNRRAIIDAATAAELAMTTLIDKCLATANTDESVRNALLERYTALGGRASLLRRLRSDLLSAQLQRDLIEPRNLATHGGHSLTDAQAQTAVDMATDIVEEAYPIASLLPT
jgi:hypothetical protein